MQLNPEAVLMTSQSGAIPVGVSSTVEAGPGARPRQGDRLTRLSWKVRPRTL